MTHSVCKNYIVLLTQNCDEHNSHVCESMYNSFYSALLLVLITHLLNCIHRSSIHLGVACSNIGF